MRHTADARRHRGISCRNLRELVRYHDAPVYTITYYVHWLLMEQHRRARLPDLGQRHRRRRAVHRLLRPPPRLPGRRSQRPGRATRRALAAWQRARRSRSCAIRSCSDPDLFVDDPGVPRPHLSRRRRVRGVPAPTPWREPFAESRYTDELLRNRMLNELFHESGAGDPARGRSQRHVLLDREPLAVPRSRPVRVLPAASRRGTSCATGAPRRCCATRCAASCPDAVLDNRRKVGFNAPILDFLDVARPGVRDDAARRQPDLRLRAPRRDRGAARQALTCRTARASSCSTS